MRYIVTIRPQTAKIKPDRAVKSAIGRPRCIEDYKVQRRAGVGQVSLGSRSIHELKQPGRRVPVADRNALVNGHRREAAEIAP